MAEKLPDPYTDMPPPEALVSAHYYERWLLGELIVEIVPETDDRV